MKLYLRTVGIGALLLTAAMVIYSPSVMRALIDPRYTPPYWNR